MVNNAHVLVQIELLATAYRIATHDHIFHSATVGQRDEIQLTHRREAVEAADIAPEAEAALLHGINRASGTAEEIRKKTYEDMSVRTSFCPTHELQTRFPASILLPDCVISQRSMAFFREFPSIMGKFDGLYKPFKEEEAQRTLEDTTRQCDDEDLQAYLMYIATQGTHYVSGVDMGCRVTWTHTVQRTDLKNVLRTVRKMSRLQRCSGLEDYAFSAKAGSRKERRKQQERDAEIGQKLEDALGPPRKNTDEDADASANKEYTKAAQEGSSGDTPSSPHQSDGPEQVPTSKDLCSDINGKTLIDLGVVNPTLRFVGGDLSLAPR